MARKFLSSVDALGLGAAATGQTAAGVPAAGAAFLNTPLFRYGARILAALKGEPAGSLPIGRLLDALQQEVGPAFDIGDALKAIGDLQSAGALRSDGATVTITPDGRSAAA